MGYDYFLSEIQQRAVRWTDNEGVTLCKRIMAHLHALASAEQWRATGLHALPNARAYAIVAGCAAECCRGEWS